MNEMEESAVSNAFNNIKQQVIEYEEQYNSKFRPVTNTPIITVEISPTGSGKNTFYDKSPNTIMIMPSNSMVVQNDGMISLNKALELDVNNTNKYRTQWNELMLTKCDYMTYDKFYGHIIGGKESIVDMNIIIDEAHLLLANNKEEYKNLVMALLNRKVNFKELKLISATLRVETLSLFNKHIFDVNIYQKKNFAPHIHFVTEFPKVDPTQRTLIFINSVDKMYQIEKYLNDKYNAIKIISLKSGDELPTEKEIEDNNVLLSTSVIRQGYSISNKIDKIIIHNVNNSEGAIGILQYMARPRNQLPEVYVIRASTHFDMDKKPKGKDELDLRESTLEIIKKQNIPNSNQTTEKALALCVDSWATKVKQSTYHDNPVLSSYLFENEMKNIELYMTDGEFMKLSINDFLPHATIDIDVKLNDTEDIKFNKLDISDYIEQLLKLTSVDDVKVKIDEIIKDINNSKDIKEENKKRIIKKLKDIVDVEPFRDFTVKDTLYEYTDTIIVKQMIDEYTYNRCKWHQFNLDNSIYILIKANIQSTRRLKIGSKELVSKIDNKFKAFIKPLKLAKTASGIKILERLYSFEQYDQDNNKIKAKVSTKTDYVQITSLYPIENNWYINNKTTASNQSLLCSSSNSKQ